MAMTKKEKAEFDARLLKAETLAALRWTGEVEPDIPVPKYGDKPTSGWTYNVYNKRIEQAWSEPNAHGDGPHRVPRQCYSQCGIALYSTRSLALAAMRNRLEQQSAEALLAIDKQIEAAKS